MQVKSDPFRDKSDKTRTRALSLPLPSILTLTLCLIFCLVLLFDGGDPLTNKNGGANAAAASTSINFGIPSTQMDSWTSKFGSPLYNFVQSITKYNELHGRYQNSRDSTVEKVDPSSVLDRILESFKATFQEKVDVLTKTAVWAEERAKDYYMTGKVPPKFNYVNSKRVNDDVKPEKGVAKWNFSLELDTVPVRHFSKSQRVNLTTSTIHVPTTTYDLDPTLLTCINWTSDMDMVLISNWKAHPTLNMQYFCSETGMLRQFPGIKWAYGSSPNLLVNQDTIDTYDCRMRPWYIGAASSHKSIVILLDISGSMTGLRSKIATHVAYTILETLTDNDKMAVLYFNNETTPVVACFENKFVEATPENLRSVKQGLQDQEPGKFVNLTYALERAFDMFAQAPPTVACNRAIFLVTDGAPSNNVDLIRAKQNESSQVRIFTYLIGREATDAANVQHIACNNNGYFSHLSTLSQVQEQVLKYIPVMSRPIVFSTARDVSWTPIYVNDVVPPHINPAITTQGFEYMISASLAVHEAHEEQQRNETEESVAEMVRRAVRSITNPSSTTGSSSSSTSTLGILQNQNKKTKVQFLGVVGTDIPLRELYILSNPFSLGTNGYTFLITNNGHVVFHPRWTPHVPKSDEHDEAILKPNYQAMDIGEIEIVDSDSTWRNNDTILMEMRHELLMQQRGSKKRLKIRIPLDEFKRIAIRTQTYEYTRIPHTPYTLAVAVQDGMNRFVGRFDPSEAGDLFDHESVLETNPANSNSVNEASASGITNDDKPVWFLRPDWLYCEYLQSDTDEEVGDSDSKEDEVLQILNKLGRRGEYAEAWKVVADNFFGALDNNATGGAEKIRCNKELVESLVFDANATEVFKSNKLWNFGEKDQKLIDKYGVLKAFLTTRSGLSRWVQLGPEDEFEDLMANNTVKVLSEMMQIDSVYYQRAIDHYGKDPNSFVYTISSENPAHIIATRAVYTNRNGLFAPVAVVGLQFDQAKWAARFFDVANTVCITGDKDNCKYSCKTSEFDCFILDDNGYVIVAEDEADNGKFFGDIHSGAMEGLIAADIYRPIEFYDYQSICFEMSEEVDGKAGAGSVLTTPLTHIQNLWSWLTAKLLWIAMNFVQASWTQDVEDDDDLTLDPRPLDLNATDEDDDSPTILTAEEMQSIPSSSLYDYRHIVLCDMKYNLYTFGTRYNPINFSHTETLSDCGHNCIGFFSSHFIPHTNLILVITDGTCACGSPTKNGAMSEEVDDANPLKKTHAAHGERFDYSNNCPPRAAYETRLPEVCNDLNAASNKERNIQQECGGATRAIHTTNQQPALILLVSLLTYLSVC